MSDLIPPMCGAIALGAAASALLAARLTPLRTPLVVTSLACLIAAIITLNAAKTPGADASTLEFLGGADVTVGAFLCVYWLWLRRKDIGRGGSV